MVSDTLDRVRDLGSRIAAAGEEAERTRGLPAGLVAELQSAGCYRMLVPRAYGGDELGLREALAVVEELARHDGAAGWNIMIGSSNLVVFGLFPRSTFELVYGDGPDVVTGGSHAPKGRAAAVDGGYVVSGQWPFASGCESCDWLVANSIVRDDRAEHASDGGTVTRLGVFPAAQVTVVDTWDAIGLRGTGSHDIALDRVFCPADRTCDVFGTRSELDHAVFRIPPVAQLGLFLAAVAVGIAQGALDDIVALAVAGRTTSYEARRISRSHAFQTSLGEADATLRAARAFLHTEADLTWHRAVDRKEFTLLDRARMRATSAKCARLAGEVVRAAYTAGGSSSVYRCSPLERRFRDMTVLQQHAGVRDDFFTMAGTILAGEKIDTFRI